MKRIILLTAFICFMLADGFSQVVGSGQVTWNGNYLCCFGSLNPFPGEGEIVWKGPNLISYTISYTFTKSGDNLILTTKLISSIFDKKISTTNGDIGTYNFSSFTAQTPQLITNKLNASCEMYYNSTLIKMLGFEDFKFDYTYKEGIMKCGSNISGLKTYTSGVGKQMCDNKFEGRWEIRNLSSPYIIGADIVVLSNCQEIKNDFEKFIVAKKTKERDANKTSDITNNKTAASTSSTTIGNVNKNNQYSTAVSNSKIVTQQNDLEQRKQLSKENYQNQLKQSDQIENARNGAYNSIENSVWGKQANNLPDNQYDASVLAKKQALESQLNTISGYNENTTVYNQQIINDAAAVIANLGTDFVNSFNEVQAEFRSVKTKIFNYELKRSKAIELSNLTLKSEKKVFLQKALSGYSCQNFTFEDLFSNEIVPKKWKDYGYRITWYDVQKSDQRRGFLSSRGFANNDSSYIVDNNGGLKYNNIILATKLDIFPMGRFSQDNNSVLSIDADQSDFTAIKIFDITNLNKTRTNTKKEIYSILEKEKRYYIIKGHQSSRDLQGSPNLRFVYRKYNKYAFLGVISNKDSDWKNINWLSSFYSENNDKVLPLNYFTLEYVDLQNYKYDEKGIFRLPIFLTFNTPNLLSFEFLPNSDDSVLILNNRGEFYKAHFPSGKPNENNICNDQIDIKVAKNLTDKSFLNHKIAFSDDAKYFICLATVSPKNWELMDPSAASKLYLFDYTNFRLISELPVNFHLVLDSFFYKGKIVVYGLDEYGVFIQKMYDPDIIVKELSRII